MFTAHRYSANTFGWLRSLFEANDLLPFSLQIYRSQMGSLSIIILYISGYPVHDYNFYYSSIISVLYINSNCHSLMRQYASSNKTFIFGLSYLSIVPPSIIGINPENLTVVVDNFISLTCEVTGFPPPDISWLKNGNVMSLSTNALIVPGM